MIESAAAKPNAGAAPTHPTSTPPSAGPLANAMVRASSIRAFAEGNSCGETSEGTKVGVATLYATVPHTATKPSRASSGSVSRPNQISRSVASSAAARNASAPAITARREKRSASSPAGIANRMNGSVSAVCNRPVWPSPTPSSKHRHDGRCGQRDLLGGLGGKVRPGEAVEGRGELVVLNLGHGASCALLFATWELRRPEPTRFPISCAAKKSLRSREREEAFSVAVSSDRYSSAAILMATWLPGPACS